MWQLFGEQIATNVIMLAYVKTCESRQETDSLCPAGKLFESLILVKSKLTSVR